MVEIVQQQNPHLRDNYKELKRLQQELQFIMDNIQSYKIQIIDQNYMDTTMSPTSGSR